MKNIVILTLVLLTTINGFAATELLCQVTPGQTHGAFGLSLTPLSSENSNFYYITRAGWGYNYSSSFMICSKSYLNTAGAEQFSCIGYLTLGGLIEASVKLLNGTGKAKIHNLGNNVYYGQTEGMELPCRLKR